MLSELWIVEVVMLELLFLAHDSIAHYIGKHFWMRAFHLAVFSDLLAQAQASYSRSRCSGLSRPCFIVVVKQLFSARVIGCKFVLEGRVYRDTVFRHGVERFPPAWGGLVLDHLASKINVVSHITREGHLVFIVDHHSVGAAEKIARPVWANSIPF